MFHTIGTHNGTTLVFSRAIPIQSDSQFAQILTEIAEIRGPWTWFFDCADLQALHMRYIQSLATVLRMRADLQQVWILNCNVWMRKILGLFATEKVHTVSAKGGRLEVLDVLRKAGFPNTMVDQIIVLAARPHS